MSSRRSLGGPWSKLSKQKKKSSTPSKPRIVASVESWEELDDANILLALPVQQSDDEEEQDNNQDNNNNNNQDNNQDNQEADWDNSLPPQFPPRNVSASTLPLPVPFPSTPSTHDDFESELAQHRSLSSSRPILLINAKVARSGAKSLSQTAINEIQSQLQQALADDFENRAEQLFQSGVCFHTDTSNGGVRLEMDRSVLQELHPGEKFVAIEYPSEYIGGGGKIQVVEDNHAAVASLVSLWENVTQPSSSRAITMLVACIRECHHTMEWKSAMRSEIDRLGQKQQHLLEQRMVKEMELIRKCDDASDNLNRATAAVIQCHDGFAETVAESTETTGKKAKATLKEAREQVGLCKLATMEANNEFQKFEQRQRRRVRRTERRVQEEQARKQKLSESNVANGSNGTSNELKSSTATATATATATTASTTTQNKQKMSLLDQIIAVVFDGIPLGQRIPVEVGGPPNPLSEIVQDSGGGLRVVEDQKVLLETHFRCLLGAQLRIRHQWIVDFGYVPLHEFDRGVESGTDSDSDGDAEEETFKQEEQELQVNLAEGGNDDSDSGSDGWRRRGGGLNWSSEEEEDDDDAEKYDDDRRRREGAGGDNGSNASGFHVISTPSFLR